MAGAGGGGDPFGTTPQIALGRSEQLTNPVVVDVNPNRCHYPPRPMRSRLLVTVFTFALLAGCGSSASGNDDGRYDLGGGVSAEVHKVTESPDSVTVDLEWFNDTDQPVDKTLDYGVFLYTADGQEVDPTIGDPPMPKTIPAGSSVRGSAVFNVKGNPTTLLLYGEIGADPVQVDLSTLN